MSLNITLLLLGVGAGSIIALSALGLVLMYRSSGVVNFATGGIGMACSFVFWDLTRQSGWSTLPAGILCVVLGAVLGLITYVLVMVLPRTGSNLTRVIATLAVLIILESAVQLRYGPNPLAVDEYLPQGSVDFGGGVAAPASRLILIAIAVVLSVALALVYSRTTFGLATTAASENRRKLAAFGWRIGTVGSVNWALGGALAGLAGVLLAPITGVAISNGHTLMVTVLAAALIGGLRSFWWTLAGGIAIGMMQSLFGIHDLGITGLADAVPFIAIIGVLAIRGRSLPLRSFIGERLPRVGTGLLRPSTLVLAVLVSLVLIGPVLNDNGTAALTTTLIAAKLTDSFGWPFPVVLVVGVLGTIPVGLIVGLPSARTRGVSLAVATLGLSVAVEALVFKNDSITGGQNGIPLSDDASFRIFGFEFDSFVHVDRFAYLVLGFVVLVAVLVANLRRGASGRRMIAVRGNERAAAGLGINVVATKLSAFAVAAAIAGLGGVLSAFRGPIALFTQITVLSNISAIGYSVVGGAGSVAGALVGSTLQPAGIGNSALTSLFDVSPVTMALVGGFLLVFTIITSPDGIAAATMDSIGSLRRRLVRNRQPRTRRRALFLDSVSNSDRDEPLGVRPAVLIVRSISVAFGAVQALDGVELDVRPGEVVGVIGANGAGKTTLIDAITGFVRSSGSVQLDGRELSAMSTHARARCGVGRSWQSIEMIEDLSVSDNLRFASDTNRWWCVVTDLVWPRHGRPTPAMVRAVEALDLGDDLWKMPGELSTGKRKLVALARAMAGEPSVLLLDEPCSGLDQKEREEVSRVIKALATDWGMGVLLVEHDVHMVRRVSDRVVALDFGKVIAEGEPVDVLSDARVMSAFLGEAVSR